MVHSFFSDIAKMEMENAAKTMEGEVIEDLGVYIPPESSTSVK